MRKNKENQPIIHGKWAAIVLGAVAVLAMAAVVARYAAAREHPDMATLPALPAAAAEEAYLLDINEATREELESLPGIGPVTAGQILAWREENGPFRSEEDILAVNGIGDAKLERLRPYITY